jgi:hypothetical protein
VTLRTLELQSMNNAQLTRAWLNSTPLPPSLQMDRFQPTDPPIPRRTRLFTPYPQDIQERPSSFIFLYGNVLHCKFTPPRVLSSQSRKLPLFTESQAPLPTSRRLAIADGENPDQCHEHHQLCVFNIPPTPRSPNLVLCNQCFAAAYLLRFSLLSHL